jgi:rhodanese-related sulfurtransferase
LLQRGYTYVDVRSEPEFILARPPGAFNVPLQRVEGDRLEDNPEFDDVMLAAFRTTDPLIVGCRSGARSRTAIERLGALGFSVLAQLRYGFSGARDAFGRLLPGWVQQGLPIETGDAATRAYAEVRKLPRAAGPPARGLRQGG